MEATRSSETSIYIKPTRRHITQDGILHGAYYLVKNVNSVINKEISYTIYYTIY
jgi:hypothetical protein